MGFTGFYYWISKLHTCMIFSLQSFYFLLPCFLCVSFIMCILPDRGVTWAATRIGTQCNLAFNSTRGIILCPEFVSSRSEQSQVYPTRSGSSGDFTAHTSRAPLPFPLTGHKAVCVSVYSFLDNPKTLKCESKLHSVFLSAGKSCLQKHISRGPATFIKSQD